MVSTPGRLMEYDIWDVFDLQNVVLNHVILDIL